MTPPEFRVRKTFLSIDEAFDELLHRIELNQSLVTLASQRYNAVKTTIENVLPGKSVRQVGSFQRKTKIRPLDLSDRIDVDVLVSFGPFYQYASAAGHGTTPSRALEIVRHALSANQTYKVMPQQQEHPIVRLEYADQMAIELIPAYEDRTGQHPRPSGPACYIVGTSSGSWKSADYDYDAETISALNGISEGKLVPIIKLVKAYFRSATIPLKSFHTEILVANIVPATIRDWETKGYSYGYQHLLASFLTQASKIVTSPSSLVGSYSPPTNSDLSQSMLSSVAAFLISRAQVAWQLAGNKIVSNALGGWREFFGDIFPS
jgi:Second Messenger Oligonucleotide or Dinucleotide Synthetase domain